MFKKTLLGLLAFIFLTAGTKSDDAMKKALEKLHDNVGEAYKNEATLRFKDAENGKAIDGGQVIIANFRKELKTNADGTVKFPLPPNDGKFSFTFKKKGHITTKLTFEVKARTIFFNRFAISKQMPLEYLRLVLNWGPKPTDLDAHLKKEGGSSSYHISYRKKKVAKDNSAQLDIDQLRGYGPETITITKLDNNANYDYWVEDYTKSGKMGRSRASVVVYGQGDKQLKSYYISYGNLGNKWKVFSIKKGKIIKR